MKKTRIPFYTPFIKQKKDIDRSSVLYSINTPLQFFHADIGDIRFYSASIYSCLKLMFIQ